MLYLLLAVMVISGGCYLIGRQHGQNEATRASETKVDTLVVFDTITQYKPVVEERVKLEKVYVQVEKTDTLWKRDTMYVFLQKEQVIWEDSLARVYASGINPQVDSVIHYVPERIVTKEVTRVVTKPYKWGLGVHAGYGFQFGSQVYAAPYIGIGVSYNILSF